MHSPVRLISGAWQLDFNRNLEEPKFWTGEEQSRIAILALVNTMAAVSATAAPATPAKVQILVEGKPLPTVGQFDTGDPIDADQTLVDQP